MMNSPLLSPRGRGNLSNFLKAVVPTWLSCSRGGWRGGLGVERGIKEVKSDKCVTCVRVCVWEKEHFTSTVSCSNKPHPLPSTSRGITTGHSSSAGGETLPPQSQKRRRRRLRLICLWWIRRKPGPRRRLTPPPSTLSYPTPTPTPPLMMHHCHCLPLFNYCRVGRPGTSLHKAHRRRGGGRGGGTKIKRSVLLCHIIPANM